MGCVVVVTRSQEQYTVRSVARPGLLNIAPDLRRIECGKTWQVADESGACIDLSKAETRSDIRLKTGSENLSQEYTFEVESLARYMGEQSFLIVFQMVEAF
jgi:hypothetical protein